MKGEVGSIQIGLPELGATRRGLATGKEWEGDNGCVTNARSVLCRHRVSSSLSHLSL